MSELTDVLSAIESLSARGQKLALATIVAVSGSTYRRPGARLLVPEEGDLVGNISGGCLENDVADVAKIVMSEGVARIVSFDLTADDDAVWGWGLGCNGAFELFVEPADKAAEVAGALRMALEEERPIAMVTVLDSSVPNVEQGDRLLVKPGGQTERSLGDPTLDGAAKDAAIELLGAERGCTVAVRAGVEAVWLTATGGAGPLQMTVTPGMDKLIQRSDSTPRARCGLLARPPLHPRLYSQRH